MQAVSYDPVRLNDRPLYSFLVQFPAVCFTAALVADIAYWQTAEFMWETFAVWLLAGGCLMAGVTGIAGLVYFFGDRRLRAGPMAWPHALVSLLVAVLSVFNAFVHSRDGYTAVVPDGIVLSLIVVLLMVGVAWMGWDRSIRVVRTGVSA